MMDMKILAILPVVFVLAASLSVGQGVQDTIARESRRHDFLRRIEVRPQFFTPGADKPAEEVPVPGAMSDAKRRLR